MSEEACDDDLGQVVGAVNAVRVDVASVVKALQRLNSLDTSVKGVERQMRVNVEQLARHHTAVATVATQLRQVAQEQQRQQLLQQRAQLEAERAAEEARKAHLEAQRVRVMLELEDARRAAQRQTAQLWFSVDRAVAAANARSDPVLRWLLLLVARYELHAHQLNPAALSHLADMVAAQRIVDVLGESVRQAHSAMSPGARQSVLDFQDWTATFVKVGAELGALRNQLQQVEGQQTQMRARRESTQTRLAKPRGVVGGWFYATFREGSDGRSVTRLAEDLARMDRLLHELRDQEKRLVKQHSVARKRGPKTQLDPPGF